MAPDTFNRLVRGFRSRRRAPEPILPASDIPVANDSYIMSSDSDIMSE